MELSFINIGFKTRFVNYAISLVLIRSIMSNIFLISRRLKKLAVLLLSDAYVY